MSCEYHDDNLSAAKGVIIGTILGVICWVVFGYGLYLILK